MNTCNEDVGMIAGMSQACSQEYWWLRMDYLHDKNLYVIGGYLASLNSPPKCFLIDFINASWDTKAKVLTFSEAVHFLLEDVGVLQDMKKWYHMVIYLMPRNWISTGSSLGVLKEKIQVK